MNREEILTLGTDINKMIYDYHNAGKSHAKENSLAWLKEQSMKIILNEQKRIFINRGHNVSKSEILALASDDYKEVVSDTQLAKEKANSLLIDMKTIEFKIMAQFSLNKLAVSGGKLY